jgi:alpha-glucuronidase
MRKGFIAVVHFLIAFNLYAEDGYQLWLRYQKIDDVNLLQQYRSTISSVYFTDNSAIALAAKEEMLNGLRGLLSKKKQKKISSLMAKLS